MRNDGLAYHSFSDIDWDSPSGLSRFSSPTSLACEDISVTSLSFSLASSRLSAGFLTFVVGRVVTGICVRRRLRMQKMHRLSIQLTQTSHIWADWWELFVLQLPTKDRDSHRDGVAI